MSLNKETKLNLIQIICTLLYSFRSIGQMSRVFANGPEDRGSIPGRVITKMVLDAALLNSQQFKVRIKGKVKQTSEWSSTPPLNLSVVAIEKGAFESSSTKVTNFTFLLVQFQLFLSKTNDLFTIMWLKVIIPI